MMIQYQHRFAARILLLIALVVISGLRVSSQTVQQGEDVAEWCSWPLEVQVLGAGGVRGIPLNANVSVYYDNTRLLRYHHHSGREDCGGMFPNCHRGKLPYKPVRIIITHEGYDTLILHMDPRIHKVGSALKAIDQHIEPIHDDYSYVRPGAMVLYVFMKKPGESWTHIRYGRYPYVPGSILVYGPDTDRPAFGNSHNNPV